MWTASPLLSPSSFWLYFPALFPRCSLSFSEFSPLSFLLNAVSVLPAPADRVVMKLKVSLNRGTSLPLHLSILPALRAPVLWYGISASFSLLHCLCILRCFFVLSQTPPSVFTHCRLCALLSIHWKYMLMWKTAWKGSEQCLVTSWLSLWFCLRLDVEIWTDFSFYATSFTTNLVFLCRDRMDCPYQAAGTR